MRASVRLPEHGGGFLAEVRFRFCSYMPSSAKVTNAAAATDTDNIADNEIDSFLSSPFLPHDVAASSEIVASRIARLLANSIRPGSAVEERNHVTCILVFYCLYKI